MLLFLLLWHRARRNSKEESSLHLRPCFAAFIGNMEYEEGGNCAGLAFGTYQRSPESSKRPAPVLPCLGSSERPQLSSQFHPRNVLSCCFSSSASWNDSLCSSSRWSISDCKAVRAAPEPKGQPKGQPIVSKAWTVAFGWVWNEGSAENSWVNLGHLSWHQNPCRCWVWTYIWGSCDPQSWTLQLPLEVRAAPSFLLPWPKYFRNKDTVQTVLTRAKEEDKGEEHVDARAVGQGGWNWYLRKKNWKDDHGCVTNKTHKPTNDPVLLGVVNTISFLT